MAVLMFPVFLSLAGALPAWCYVYFNNGFSNVKRSRGVDWREFVLAIPGFWLTHVLFWPVGVIAWFANGKPAKSLAAIEMGGRQVRTVVPTDRYEVRDGVATPKSSSAR